MKKILGILCLALLPMSVWAQDDSAELTQEEYEQLVEQFVASLDRKTGTVELQDGIATLEVPDSFYYLDAQDADRVLVELWGNPEGGTLGMLFPADVSPADNHAWGVTIEYEEEGYVSDEGADSIDYDELLAEMQRDSKEISEYRVENGYEPIRLVGWAAPPHYEPTSHKLYWAKELQFGEDATHTLNYNIRVLGRKGVLVLNFIAGMDQLPAIESNLDTVLALADFNEGSRYSDFDPSVDKMAAYGLGGLVAGKVLAKTGILAAVFIFLKKFGILIVAGIGGLFAKLFKRKRAAAEE